MQFIQQQLAIVGVKVNVEPLEAGVLTAKEFNVKRPGGCDHRHAVQRLVVLDRRC